MTFYRKSTAIPWIIFYRILTVSITEMPFSNWHSLHSRCSVLVDAPLKILLCAVFLIQYTQLLTHSIALQLALGQEPVHRGITSTCSLQTSGSMVTRLSPIGQEHLITLSLQAVRLALVQPPHRQATCSLLWSPACADLRKGTYHAYPSCLQTATGQHPCLPHTPLSGVLT